MTFKVGDKVRDAAELAGQVITVWGDAAKVRWYDHYETWISQRFLHLDEKKQSADNH